MASEVIYEGPLQFSIPELIREPVPLQEGLLGDGVEISADTMGWDTTYAIRLPDVNQAITAAGSSPASWSQVSDPSYQSSGTFGDWRVARGGNGGLLHMEIPIATGSMTFNSTTHPMDGATATIELRLAFVRMEGQEGPEPHELRAGTDIVTVMALNDLPGTPSTSTRALMIGSIQEWFNVNLAEFSHTFCAVNLSEQTLKDTFAWLQPTSIGYAYIDGPDDYESLFGVLAMTENQAATGIPYQLSPAAIPANQRAGFTISAERYLEKLMRPGIATMFEGATEADFEVDPYAKEVRNTRALTMAKAQVDDGMYTPDLPVGGIAVRVAGSELIIDLKELHIEVSPGVNVYMNFTSYSRLTLAPKSDGDFTIGFEESRPSSTIHRVDLDPGIKATGIVLGIIIGVLSAFVGVGGIAEKSAKQVVVAVILLVVAGTLTTLESILEAVAEGGVDAIPGIDELALNATAPTTWPGAQQFTPTSVGLNGSFQIGGDPGFPS